MAVPTLKFSNGYEMPVIGLGTYKSKAGEVERAIKDAIDTGYRHIDCAYFYGNETEIGNAIREKIADGTVKRQDLFITSKLWNSFHSKKLVVPMIKKSLENLGLEYLDLYLIHWPIGFKEDATLSVSADIELTDIDYLETWEGMEECVDLGLAKSIGVSNFNSQQLQRVLDNCRIRPVNNQVEVTPNLNQKKLIEFCRQREVTVTAYSPLGQPDRATIPKPSIHDEGVKNLAKKYNKTPAQIVLKYLLSLGIAVIPKSVTKSRIIENINLFDFNLTKEEITYMDSLNTNQRIVLLPQFNTHKYYPFHIEF